MKLSNAPIKIDFIIVGDIQQKLILFFITLSQNDTAVKGLKDLSITIVESGLDIPTANTMIVHRADMFGLAQLYQMRGRVGRSKTRAYALMTLPPNKVLTATAERRLKVLQSLDTLGAGFQLASHDLDIRGAGNILGEEQSGHVREVGFELYQQMLEEAVAELKDGGDAELDGKWSPQITVGATVMIPENYVPDLTLRMSLYRRLAELDTAEDIDAFGAELIDRFGPLPDEVDHLLKIVFIKSLCRKANIEKLEVKIEGMTCDACQNHVNHAVNDLEGIVSIETSYDKGNSVIEYDKTKTDQDEIKKAVESIGYTATELIER